MDGAANADPSTVVEGHPRCPRCRVQQGVEQRPVGNGVGSIQHGLGLPVGARHASRVQVVPADHDRRRELSRGHHLVEAKSGEVALLVAEPANTGRQSFELDLLSGLLDPATKVFVVGEELEDGFVGLINVLGVSRQRRPAEGSFALCKEGANIGGNEAGEVKSPGISTKLCFCPNRVAVVEDDGTTVLEGDHGLDLLGHGSPGGLGEGLGVLFPKTHPLLHRDALGKVAERIVGAGLVGDDIDRHLTIEEFLEDVGGVTDHPNRQGLLRRLRFQGSGDRDIQIVGHLIEVAVIDAALQTRRVDIDDDDHTLVHGDSERLGSAHTAAATGQGQGSRQRATEVFSGDSAEGLIGSLQDALGSDVDPGPSGHLPIHRETRLFEAPEFWPVGPVSDEVRVGDENPRRPLVGAKDANGLSGLDQQGLVWFQVLKFPNNRVKAWPVPGRLSGAAIDHELFGVFCHLGVEVVHQHAHGTFCLPCLGGSLCSPGGSNTGVGFHGVPFSYCAVSPAAVWRVPSCTSATTASISGWRNRSGPGPAVTEEIASCTLEVAAPGRSGARSANALLADNNSMASTRESASTAFSSLRPACQPIDTWSSCIAELGIESTDAGCASRFISVTKEAAVYWAIMRPESTPTS